MRRSRILILLFVSFGVLGCLISLHAKENAAVYAVYLQYDEVVLGVPCISSQEVYSRREKKEGIEQPEIFFEGVLLPYDISTKTFYLSQNYLTGVWQGELALDTNDSRVLLFDVNDWYWQDKKQAISDSHSFTLWVADKESYQEFELIVTGTPIISINTKYEVMPEEVSYEEDPDKLYFGSEIQKYGTIDIFDPGTADRKYELTQMRVKYHEKGASTKGFEKKGYSLSLLDYKEENMDVSLLGLRSDNSWKLNALVTDSSKVREKTASQIWEYFDAARPELNEAGPRMEYVELVLDGDYRGIYCLVEPVDEKKLELDNNDILYKVIDWNIPTDENIQNSIDSKWRIIYPIRIRYPKVINDYQRAWMPIRDYLNVFYRSSEKLTSDELEKKIDKDNLIDMAIFTMATSASDNFFKNTYYVAEVSNTGTYVMRQIPWDLDYTFGNIYQMGAHNNTFFDTQYDKVYIEHSLYQLQKADPEAFGEQFWLKWIEYRESFLRFENIVELLTENRDYLIQTGAITREEDRWQDEVDTELEEMLEYIELRLQWLDKFFYEWR